MDRPLPRPQTPAPGMSLADIYYILFRHKWKILSISATGLALAALLPVVWRVPYKSEAKLFIRYVLETKSPGQMAGNDSRVKSPDEQGENLINTELEILTSLDLAQQVADAVGPQKILARTGGGNDKYSAAAVIHNNLLAEVPKRSSVIRLVFQHPDPEVVQPVLGQLLDTYRKKHAEIHRAVGVFDDFLTQETDQLRSRLVQTEDELRKAKAKAGVLSLEDSKKVFSEQTSKIQQEIFNAEADLAERKASVAALANLLHTPVPASAGVPPATSATPTGAVEVAAALVNSLTSNVPALQGTNALAQTNVSLAFSAPAVTRRPARESDASKTTLATNATAAPAPPDKVAEYRKICGILDNLQKRLDLLLDSYTTGSTMVKPTEDRMVENEKVKAQLEEQFPGLLSMPGVQPRSSDAAAGSNPRLDLTTETAKVTALEARIRVLTNQLGNIRTNAASIDLAEGSITELQRKKELEEGHYKYFSEKLEQSRIDEALGAGRVSNISTIQSPSAPFQDRAKLQKARAMVLFGSLAAALALAFLIDLYFDRSLKRAGEIESRIGLPLFITIPLMGTNGNGRLNGKKVPLLGNGHTRQLVPSQNDEAAEDVDSALAPQPSPLNTTDTSSIQDPVASSTPDPRPSPLTSSLRPFSEALRDRLIAFFELKNLTHKPKLVAVTSCAAGTGVSTVASGLAASLSETGDGNVLLVDMRNGSGTAHDFHRGKMTCSLDEALETEKRGEALVQENLYVVSESANPCYGNGDKLPRVMPKRFNRLLPRLKASDYDYIIFDMPAISQVSITPRLARFMDMMLVVVESEKTDRDLAKRAFSLISEPRPNMGAVLNKSRTYVPKLLQQEL